jgi:hypothetical protein
MEMPKPGEAHKKLERLVGAWRGTETMHPAPWDPAGGPAQGHVVNRWVTGGFAVVQEYRQRRGGVDNFSGHGVFWFDQARQEYVMTWWDSMGGMGAEYRGGFNGDVLELKSAMPQGGYARTSFDLGTPGRYGFRMDISMDGASWQPAMEGQYEPATAGRAVKRKAGKPSARKAAPSARKAAPRARKTPTRTRGTLKRKSGRRRR